MIDPMVILPYEYADRIEKCGKSYGYIDVRDDEPEGVYVVDGFTKGEGGGIHGASKWVGHRHYLAHAPRTPNTGFWYRVDHAIHEFGRAAAVRRGAVPLDTFRAAVDNGWIAPGNHQALVVTYADAPDNRREWAAWILDGAQAAVSRITMQVVHEQLPVLAPLIGHWPLLDLSDLQIAVVGTGSIGSAACDALIAYGIHRLALVDPQRLFLHNFARHRAHPSQLGRRKVIAERERLLDRDPTLDIEALPIDVIDDADVIRPLLDGADLVLVTSDGIESRRVANHLVSRV